MVAVAKYLLEISRLCANTASSIPLSSLTSADHEWMATYQSTLAVQQKLDDVSIQVLLRALTARGLWPPLSNSNSNEDTALLQCKLAYLAPFMKITETLLSIGADDRSTMDFHKPQKQTKYLSTTFATDDKLVHRGSCTCSSTYTDTIAFAEQLRQQLVDDLLHEWEMVSTESQIVSVLDRLLESRGESIIQRLRKLLALSDELCTDVVLFPSGSDAEFLPLSVALAQSSTALSLSLSETTAVPRVLSIVTAAGEVGSGTANASIGKQFSVLTPQGNTVRVGDALPGLPLANRAEIVLKQFTAREEREGHCRALEEEIAQSVESFLSADSHSVVVLHVVCGSKTGLVWPSMPLIRRLQEFAAVTQPSRLIVVADACQLRVSVETIHELLSAQMIVLLTGSKFFSAPPFAGAVLIPPSLTAGLQSYCQAVLTRTANSSIDQETCLIPVQGLAAFLTPAEISLSLTGLRSLLERLRSQESGRYQWWNMGLHLRWECALQTMTRYFKWPRRLITEFARLWVNHVRNAVRRHSPWLILLDEELRPHDSSTEELSMLDQDGDNIDTILGAVNSIVSIVFRVVDQSGGAEGADHVVLRRCSMDECKELHRLMSMGDAEQHVAPVQLGQPVKLSTDCVVVRIALGADVIVRVFQRAEQSLLDDSVDPTLKEERLLAHLYDAFDRGGHQSRRTCQTERLINNPLAASVRDALAEDRQLVQRMSNLCQHWGAAVSPSLAPATILAKDSAPTATLNVRAQRINLIDQTLSLSAQSSSAANSLATHAMSSLNREHLRDALRQLDTREESIEEVAIVYDLDALCSSFVSVTEAFDSLRLCSQSNALQFIHCLALKSIPISYTLSLAVRAGLGVECASICEVQQALIAQCPCDKIVFDSPCKTREELRFALSNGVRINANSFVELDRINEILTEWKSIGKTSNSLIGLRVNPLVGAGALSALSTATQRSKFGVPLFDTWMLGNSRGDLAPEENLWPKDEDSFCDLSSVSDAGLYRILDAYCRYDFLSGIMCHVGSQGMPLSLMSQGVERIAHVANLIDRLFANMLQVDRRVSWIDIGGGLSANYDSDEVSPKFSDYVQSILDCCPSLLHGTPFTAPTRTILTEFGKALVAKSAAIVARVEDVLSHSAMDSIDVEEVTCMTHAGADLLLRTAYCPDKFSHRVQLWNERHQSCQPMLLSADGRDDDENGLLPLNVDFRPEAIVTVAGPLCFSGDVLASRCPMARPRCGDEVILLDTGANTLSLFSRHCSRASPIVYGFRHFVFYEWHLSGQGDAGRVLHKKEVTIVAKIRDRESDEEVIQFWK